MLSADKALDFILVVKSFWSICHKHSSQSYIATIMWYSHFIPFHSSIPNLLLWYWVCLCCFFFFFRRCLVFACFNIIFCFVHYFVSKWAGLSAFWHEEPKINSARITWHESNNTEDSPNSQDLHFQKVESFGMLLFNKATCMWWE